MNTSNNLNKAKLVKFLANLVGLPASNLKHVVNTEASSFPIVMTVEKYVELYTKVSEGVRVLRPHPRQREITERLVKAAGKGGHLNQFSLAHTEVVIALFKGDVYIVDGNHRSKLWSLNQGTRPSHVTVNSKLTQTCSLYKNMSIFQ